MVSGEDEIREEEKRNIAIEIALQTGVLKQCEICTYVFDPLVDDQSGAYKLANYKMKNDPKVASLFDDNPRALTDRIKNVIDDFGSKCVCSK